MNLFETVKSAVTVKQAAEYYGCKVNRGDMICCPFHDDRHPSMKLNRDYFYCFGCGATGDVIDFVARLFGLSSYEAAKKLAYDFGISRLRFVEQNKMEVEVTLRGGIDGQTPALRQNATLRFLSADTPITATQQKTRTSGTAVTYTFLLDYPANADAHYPIRVQAQP